MANKLYAMEQLTEEVAKDVSANPQEWIRFLNTASRLYRYTFPEQLLIYAQRPGATAVASMEIWNQKMYRWIKKGSKGIALIDNTSGPKTKLRYVFDVQDTYKVKNLGRDPQLWNLNPEGEQLVADYLQEQLALETTEGGLPEVLHQAAEESVQAWLPDAFDELQMDVSGTFLEDLDEQNQKVEFRELMTNSVWYVLLNRCGLDVQEYLDAEDFRHITDFNQLKVMGHLGSSVNEISRPVLMQIGRYVLDDLEKDLKTVAKEKKVAYNKFNTLIRESETKNTEDREKNKEETEHERDHLQPERRVSDSRYQPGRDKRNNREVRNDEERVSEKLQGSQVQHSDTAEPSGQSSDGDRQSGKTESRQPDERTSRERSGTRQDGRHNGMDQTHEPDQSTGRGTGDPGDYLQLSLFPTEEEQFGEIRKAAAALEQPAAFLISDEVVDHILRTGSGQKNTLFHITARLIEGLDNEEMQSFLKDEYGTGGKGFTIDNQKISIWYDNDGIRIRRGDSARRNFDRIVTWEEAADRIRDMYEEGNYVDNLISNNAIEQEQKEMTDLLALHFRDTNRNTEEYRSYTDWQDTIRNAWTDPEGKKEIYQQFEWLQADMNENPSNYHRWEIQHNPVYSQRFRDLQRDFSWVDQQFKVERLTPFNIVGVVNDGRDFPTIYADSAAILNFAPAMWQVQNANVYWHPTTGLTIEQIHSALGDILTDTIGGYWESAGRSDIGDTYDSVLSILQLGLLVTSLLLLFVSVLGQINIGLSSLEQRTHELLIRRAIGASRTNIVALVLGSQLILSIFVCLAAILISLILVHCIGALLPVDSPVGTQSYPISVAVVAVAVSVLTALLGGLLPALKAAKLEPALALR